MNACPRVISDLIPTFVFILWVKVKVRFVTKTDRTWLYLFPSHYIRHEVEAIKFRNLSNDEHVSVYRIPIFTKSKPKIRWIHSLRTTREHPTREKCVSTFPHLSTKKIQTWKNKQKSKFQKRVSGSRLEEPFIRKQRAGFRIQIRDRIEELLMGNPCLYGDCLTA